LINPEIYAPQDELTKPTEGSLETPSVSSVGAPVSPIAETPKGEVSLDDEESEAIPEWMTEDVELFLSRCKPSIVVLTPDGTSRIDPELAMLPVWQEECEVDCTGSPF
jgi:hypothetical protein